MPRLRLALAPVIGVALLLPVSADAATRQVAPGGADSGGCVGAPCSSLAYAYGQAGSGDVIELAGGSYGAQELPAGSKAVTVQPAAGATPDLAQLRTLSSGLTVRGLKLRALRIAGGSRTVFEGLDIDGRFAKNLTLEHSGGTGIVVRNSRVGNVTDEKGAIVGESGFTFDNVWFHDVLVTNSSVHNECVYATGAEGLTVRNSLFTNCATMDLFFTNWAGGPDYGNVTLENNVFEHSMKDDPGAWHYYSLYVGNTGPDGGAMTNWVVRNNTFEIDAHVTRTASSGSRWVGNLGGWSCVPGVTYRYNVGAVCGSSDKRVSPDASTQTSTAPFGWVDPAAHDFRLKAGSPAIGAADPADAPATDRDGYRRDGAPDAGAHEYGAGPASSSGGGGDPDRVTSPPAGSGGAALRLRSARLTPRTICRVARRGCKRTARLRLQGSHASRATVTVRRVGRSRAARTLRRDVRATRTVLVRARGLRAGRHRVAVVLRDGSGAVSNRRTFRLRVR